MLVALSDEDDVDAVDFVDLGAKKEETGGGFDELAVGGCLFSASAEEAVDVVAADASVDA